MPQTLPCPVKKWPGSVVLPDGLTYPQLRAWDQAIERYSALGEKPRIVDINEAFAPGLLAVVAEWRIPAIASFTDAGQLPAAPLPLVQKLNTWLVAEINRLVTEADDEDPKS